jgi:NADH-ubiquinone oxidoreductase chain 2
VEPKSGVYSDLLEGKIQQSHSFNQRETTVLATEKLNKLITLRTIGEYPVIVLFSLLGGSLLIASNDLVSMYLSLELQSFSLYILASIYRDSESATFAGLKYFLLGGLSSGFILLGASLIYGFSGLTNFDMIYVFLLVNDNIVSSLGQGITNNLSFLTPQYLEYIRGSVLGNSETSLIILQLALLIIFMGFLFKIAAAPFYNWAPDVYDGVPTKVTAWLTIVPKISILIFLLTLKTKGGFQVMDLTSLDSNIDNNLIGFNSKNTLWIYQLSTSLLILSSSLSLVIGTILGLAQQKIKRLLAYSTVAHIGFILLALAIFSEESVESFIFYIIQYSVTNINIFFILLAFGYLSFKPIISNSNVNGYFKNSNNVSINAIKLEMVSNSTLYSPISFIYQLRGQYKNNPLLAFNFAIAFFSMAGVPPMVGFFSKQMVLSAAIHEGYLFISILAILTSVISAAYYLRIVKIIYFDPLVSTNSYETQTKEANRRLENSVLKEHSKNSDNGIENYYLNYIHCFIIALSSMFILLFIINPSLILNSVHLITLSIFYY